MNFQNLTERVRAALHGDRGRKWIVALGVAGIALIFLSSVLPKRSGSRAAAVSSAPSETDYAAALEQRLTDLIGRIDGVGECRVLVTLENGVKYQYAQEEKNQYSAQQDGDSGRTAQENNTQRSYVVIDSGSGKQPLVITERTPEVKGVVVVCAGADNVQVRQRVTEVVTTALALTSIQVCVAPMS